MPAIEVLNQSEPALSPILQLVRVLVIFLGLAAQIPPNKSVLPPGLPPQVSKEQCCPNEAFCLIMEMQICSDFEDRSMLRLIKTASATALMFAAQHLVSCQCFELTMRKIKTVSPQASASYISLLFFSWLDPLVWNGWKRPLRQQDLPAVSPEVLLVKKIKWTLSKVEVEKNAQVFLSRATRQRETQGSISLWRILIVCFGSAYFQVSIDWQTLCWNLSLHHKDAECQ